MPKKTNTKTSKIIYCIQYIIYLNGVPPNISLCLSEKSPHPSRLLFYRLKYRVLIHKIVHSKTLVFFLI